MKNLNLRFFILVVLIITWTSCPDGGNPPQPPVTTAPAGYTVSINSPIINAHNATNFSFRLSAAETGTTCHYAIDDTNAATIPVSGSFSVSSCR